MKILSVRSEKPVDRVIVEVLSAIESAAQELGIDYFVAGAMARDLVLQHVFAFDTIRATSDIDFAVHVSSWAQFDALKKLLIDSHQFSAVEGKAHRLKYLSAFPIDLVPFGGVVEDNGQISWPPDCEFVMNAAGYQDALSMALRLELKPGLVVPVASLAGLAMLKIFTWLDRGHENSKDAIDLALLLGCYADTIDRDDLYEDEAPVLEAVDYDLERAGARILGKHTQQLASADTAGKLLGHLKHEPTRHRLTIAMAKGVRPSDDPVGLADVLLGEFVTGLSQS